MLKPEDIRIIAAREGGNVKRGHACPLASTTYTNAQHSYNAVSLLLLLHPNPSLNLIKMLQFHDVAERWLGDLPATAKADNYTLAQAYEQEEKRVLNALGLYPPLDGLPDWAWVKSLDTLELWLWCREELTRGNENITEWLGNCETYLATLRAQKWGGDLHSMVPDPVWNFYQRASIRWRNERLPDRFSVVATMMGAAARGEPVDGPRTAGA